MSTAVQDQPVTLLSGDPTVWEPPQPAAVNRELARQPIPMIVKDHMNAGGFGWLLGRRGSYKTGLALYTAAAVIIKRPLFGSDRFEIERSGPVLYLDGHENNQLLYPRVERILNGMDATAEERERVWSNLYVKHTTGINMHTGKWVAELAEWGLENRPLLIIFDTFMRFYAGGGYTDEDTSKAIVRDGVLRRTTGAATLWLHHPPKSNGPDPFRGGSGFLDAADFAFEVKRPRGNSVLQVRCEKFRPGLEPADFALNVKEQTPDNLMEESGVLSFRLSRVIPLEKSDSDWEQIHEQVLENPGSNKSEILKAVSGQRERISHELDRRVEAGSLVLKLEGRTHRYFLAGQIEDR